VMVQAQAVGVALSESGRPMSYAPLDALAEQEA